MPATRNFVLALAALAALPILAPLQARQSAGEDPAVYLQFGGDLFEAGRYREALDAYTLAARSTDSALVARARKGKVRTALRLAEFDLALVEAEALKASGSADAEANTLLGDALWAIGMFDEADAAYG